MTATPALLLDPIEILATWERGAQELHFEEPSKDIARARLLEFVRWNQPRYLVGWFHRELCRVLEKFGRDVAAGLSPRLIVTAPPRHGKSEIVSRRFPVWHLGHHPHHEVAVASYEQSFANELSADARQVRDMAAGWWPKLAPAKGKANGVELWKVEGGGCYKAVGAGGPITGRGADVLIIDDPVKNAQEADSETIRESRWRWFQSTAHTRVSSGGGIIIMATRWHHDDLSGRALKQKERGEENWEVFDFPAIAEMDEPFRKAGEALHPARWPLHKLEQKKRGVGSRVWTAMYQGRPTTEKGGLFLRDWLGRRYTHDPQRPPKPYAQRVITVDASFKDEDTSSPVSIQCWGRWDWTEHHLLADVHGRMDFIGTVRAIADLVIRLNPHVILVEDKANGPAIITVLRKRFPAVVPFDPTPFGNKIVRAQLASPVVEGNVLVFPEAEFTSEFIEEVVNFPLGALKDRVDALTQYIVWCESKRMEGDDEGINSAMGILLAEGQDDDVMDWFR